MILKLNPINIDNCWNYTNKSEDFNIKSIYISDFIKMIL